MIDLRSMAVTMPEVAGHPNRTAFQGVLTTVDVPSQRSPSGARGHLVVLTKKAAEAALPSLLGMAVDYSPSLDRHDVRRKVGVITRAEIVGRNLEVGGYLFARDFPEIVEEIANASNLSHRSFAAYRETTGRSYRLHGIAETMNASRSEGLKHSLRAVADQIRGLSEFLGNRKRQERTNSNRGMHAEARVANGSKGLGMSYEITDVCLIDTRAKIWMLEKVTFTGAAILHRDKAAYRDTWIELA
jgi:hypothetical protein